MKRDWDVVRGVLLKLEKKEERDHSVYSVDGYDVAVVAYHIQLMTEAGLIEAHVQTYLSGELSAVATRMTWAGHEFLDKIRDQTVWGKVKASAKEKGLSLSFEVIKELATVVIKSMISP